MGKRFLQAGKWINSPSEGLFNRNLKVRLVKGNGINESFRQSRMAKTR